MEMNLFLLSFAVAFIRSVYGEMDQYSVFLIHNEPYSWQNGSSVTGLIPNLFRILASKCEHFSVDIKQVPWSLEDLKQISLSEDPLTTIQRKEKLHSISNNTIIGMNYYPEFFDSPRKFIAYPFVHSSGLVAVVHRDTIALSRKLYEAMIDSLYILYNGLLFSAIVGVLVWFVERNANSHMFPDSPTAGCFNGIWFIMVTMATVGYGDVVPKTRVGKVIVMLYMCIATLLIAALTGVYTERVSNAELDLSNSLRMSVVNGTYDVNLAMRFQKDKGHLKGVDKVKKVRTYAEALRLVEVKEVDVALVDYNVAGWLHEDILKRDLRIAKHIKQKFHKHIYIYEDHTDHERIEKLDKCFKDNEFFFEQATNDFVRPISIVQVDVTDMYYALTHFGITPIMTSAALLTFVLVVIYELYGICRKKSRKCAHKIELLANHEKMIALKSIERRIDDKFRKMKEEILEDFRELVDENVLSESSLQSTQRSVLFEYIDSDK